MSDQQNVHLHRPDGDRGGSVSPEDFRKLAERVEKLDERLAKLDRWIYFALGGASVISYLLGASESVKKFFQ